MHRRCSAEYTPGGMYPKRKYRDVDPEAESPKKAKIETLPKGSPTKADDNSSIPLPSQRLPLRLHQENTGSQSDTQTKIVDVDDKNTATEDELDTENLPNPEDNSTRTSSTDDQAGCSSWSQSGLQENVSPAVTITSGTHLQNLQRSFQERNWTSKPGQSGPQTSVSLDDPQGASFPFRHREVLLAMSVDDDSHEKFPGRKHEEAAFEEFAGRPTSEVHTKCFSMPNDATASPENLTKNMEELKVSIASGGAGSRFVVPSTSKVENGTPTSDQSVPGTSHSSPITPRQCVQPWPQPDSTASERSQWNAKTPGTTDVFAWTQMQSWGDKYFTELGEVSGHETTGFVPEDDKRLPHSSGLVSLKHQSATPFTSKTGEISQGRETSKAMHSPGTALAPRQTRYHVTETPPVGTDQDSPGRGTSYKGPLGELPIAADDYSSGEIYETFYDSASSQKSDVLLMPEVFLLSYCLARQCLGRQLETKQSRNRRPDAGKIPRYFSGGFRSPRRRKAEKKAWRILSFALIKSMIEGRDAVFVVRENLRHYKNQLEMLVDVLEAPNKDDATMLLSSFQPLLDEIQDKIQLLPDFMDKAQGFLQNLLFLRKKYLIAVEEKSGISRQELAPLVEDYYKVVRNDFYQSGDNDDDDNSNDSDDTDLNDEKYCYSWLTISPHMMVEIAMNTTRNTLVTVDMNAKGTQMSAYVHSALTETLDLKVDELHEDEDLNWDVLNVLGLSLRRWDHGQAEDGDSVLTRQLQIFVVLCSTIQTLCVEAMECSRNAVTESRKWLETEIMEKTRESARQRLAALDTRGPHYHTRALAALASHTHCQLGSWKTLLRKFRPDLSDFPLESLSKELSLLKEALECEGEGSRRPNQSQLMLVETFLTKCFLVKDCFIGCLLSFNFDFLYEKHRKMEEERLAAARGTSTGRLGQTEGVSDLSFDDEALFEMGELEEVMDESEEARALEDLLSDKAQSKPLSQMDQNYLELEKFRNDVEDLIYKATNTLNLPFDVKEKVTQLLKEMDDLQADVLLQAVGSGKFAARLYILRAAKNEIRSAFVDIQRSAKQWECLKDRDTREIENLNSQPPRSGKGGGKAKGKRKSCVPLSAYMTYSLNAFFNPLQWN